MQVHRLLSLVITVTIPSVLLSPGELKLIPKLTVSVPIHKSQNYGL